MVCTKKSLLISLTACLIHLSVAQPSTEIYLFDIDKDGKLTNPINVSNNPGYDNQPSFTNGGNHLLYTSTRGGQTDIIKYDLETGEKSWMTTTTGGEYSPTQIPGSYEFSTILLEPNGRQLLWKYSLNGGEGQILIPYLKIGYHTWVNDQLLYAFVLGPHATLQKIDLTNQRAEIIRENIGRSLHYYSPDESIVFVDKESTPWMVSLLNLKSESISMLSATLDGAEDMALGQDGFLWMGSGSKIYRMKIIPDAEWQLVQDLSDFELSGITRLSIHPDNHKIAIVVNE
jgi:hypothetical protein